MEYFLIPDDAVNLLGFEFLLLNSSSRPQLNNFYIVNNKKIYFLYWGLRQMSNHKVVPLFGCKVFLQKDNGTPFGRMCSEKSRCQGDTLPLNVLHSYLNM